MEFYVLLSVLVITISMVAARPSDTTLTTKSLMKNDDFIMRLPTKLEDSKEIVVDGIMDTEIDRLEIVFPIISSEKKTEENNICSIVYDSRNETFNEEQYTLCSSGENNCSVDYPSFTLTLSRDEIGIQMNMNINDQGPRTHVCYVQNSQDLEHIQFKQGLHVLKFSMIFNGNK